MASVENSVSGLTLPIFVLSKGLLPNGSGVLLSHSSSSINSMPFLRIKSCACLLLIDLSTALLMSASVNSSNTSLGAPNRIIGIRPLVTIFLKTRSSKSSESSFWKLCTHTLKASSILVADASVEFFSSSIVGALRRCPIWKSMLSMYGINLHCGSGSTTRISTSSLLVLPKNSASSMSLSSMLCLTSAAEPLARTIMRGALKR